MKPVKCILPLFPPLPLPCAKLVCYYLSLDHCRSLHLLATYPTSCYQMLFPKPSSTCTLAHSTSQVPCRKQGLSLNACQMNKNLAYATLAFFPLQDSLTCQSGSSSSGFPTLADLFHKYHPHGYTDHHLLYSADILFPWPGTPFPLQTQSSCQQCLF